MRILIVEDEPPIAEYIVDQVKSIIQSNKLRIKLSFTLIDAIEIIKDNSFDLCLLDLNLKGKNGFEVIEHFAASPTQIIIISAYTDRAIKAFEYGVIDFIPKPFDKQRLQLSIDRYFGKVKRNNLLKYIVYRKKNKNYIIPIEEIIYFESDAYLVNAYLRDGSVKVIEKSLKHLEKVLPNNFMRVHRSIIVDLSAIESFFNKGGGVYNIKLISGETLPLSRNSLKILSNHLVNK